MFDNKMTLPVLIISTTLVLMTAFQLRQLTTERGLIKQSLAQQEQPLKQAEQVGQQFENLAVGTARLAGTGNETAQAIMVELRKIGITVNPNAPTGQSAIERHAPEGQQGQKPADGAAAPAPTTTTPTTAQTPAAPAGVGQ